MVTLINPNSVVQRNDILTTGILYMPIGLAYFASVLKKNGFECNVIDAFGENPNQCRRESEFLVRGLTPLEVTHKIDPKTNAIFIYAINSCSHIAFAGITKAVRRQFNSIPIIVIENTQSVTACSLRRIQEQLYDIGIDYIITGEAEQRGIELLDLLQKRLKKDCLLEIDGLGFRDEGKTFYTPPKRKIEDLDRLPFPAWDLFPLQNYWKLGYAHGPMETPRYLPIITSRGCPYSCKFCVAPEMNDNKWRCRSAENVVDELEEYSVRFGVREFHLEDLNPTVSEKRILEICGEIIRRKLKIIWKIVSGTKVETIKNEDTVDIMAKAGCRYISISPESGSPRILKMFDKPFDFRHGIRLIKKMNKAGIRSQACFVLGYPGENDDDRKLTREFVYRLTKIGVDEIAIFIVSPMPGSEIFDSFSGYSNLSQLNFSPAWRKDYKELAKFRFSLYISFILWKLLYHPVKFAWQPINFMLRRFQTKMEMVPYRALHTIFISLGGQLNGNQKN